MGIRSHWRKEFKALGVDAVRAWAAASIWSEDKQQAAYRWLWWQQYSRSNKNKQWQGLAMWTHGLKFA
jgi:hypothetical protein